MTAQVPLAREDLFADIAQKLPGMISRSHEAFRSKVTHNMLIPDLKADEQGVAVAALNPPIVGDCRFTYFCLVRYPGILAEELSVAMAARKRRLIIDHFPAPALSEASDSCRA
jgi:hypothetical protein